MSLSTALYNAFSGLKANSKAATLVSTNIANATTESYGRRELDLRSGPAGTGGGVRINAVLRQTVKTHKKEKKERKKIKRLKDTKNE